MVKDIIEKFQSQVLDKYETFEKSMIHGDFNEQNILVDKKASENNYCVTGVIDFGDSQYSCLLFEIAISLTYMMFCGGSVEFGGHFLAGYEKFRKIPEHERNVLRVLNIFWLENLPGNHGTSIVLPDLLLCPILPEFTARLVHL